MKQSPRCTRQTLVQCRRHFFIACLEGIGVKKIDGTYSKHQLSSFKINKNLKLFFVFYATIHSEDLKKDEEKKSFAK